jgi:outer membrane murein-binding lipoprotein Lpp
MRGTINFEQVKQAADKLQSEGQKVSVRAVQSITGGSMTTVLELLHQWQQRQQSAVFPSGTEETLSEKLRAAIGSEIFENVSRCRAAMEAQVKAAEQRAQETGDLLKDAETREEELRVTIEADKKEITSLATQLKMTESKVGELESKVEELRKVLLEAEKRAAVAETRVEERDKSIKVLEERRAAAKAKGQKKEPK